MKSKIFGTAAAVILGIASSAVSAATLTGVSFTTNGTLTATGVDDLNVGGVLYDLDFIDATSTPTDSSFNGVFGTAVIPELNLGEALGTSIRDALAVFEQTNQFSAASVNSPNRSLLFLFGNDADSIDYVTYFTDFNGAFGPFNNERTLNFSGGSSFVVATIDNGPTVSPVPLPASSLLLLTSLLGVAAMKRQRKYF